MKAHLPAIVVILLLAFCTSLDAQTAAESRVHARYTATQLADLQANGHHKYFGLVLYYGESWFVSDQGNLRLPTEQEIQEVDIEKYARSRKETERTSVHDADSGLDLVLMGRSEFEALFLSRASAPDREAYLQQKAIFKQSESKEATN